MEAFQGKKKKYAGKASPNARSVYTFGTRGYSSSALLSITDGDANLIAAWEYDENNRVISSTHDGVGKTKIEFIGENKTLVTNPLGKSTAFTFIEKNNRRLISQVDGAQSDHCAASNRSYIYDDNGYLLSKTDWEGVVTVYIRDAYGRERSRTEASGTADALTIKTEYHETLNLPEKIITPTQTTIFAYDDMGRLLGEETCETNSEI